MHRRFREHDFRAVTDLSGVWDFSFLGDVDPEAVDSRSLTFPDRMAVPGCFDATPAYAGLRGLAAYRTWLVFTDCTPHRLVFDGVHHWCLILLDGKVVGEHMGGFTRFAVDLMECVPGRAELIVLVDNRLDYERCPLHQPHFDWYHFGGISRGVELHRLGALWIDDLRVATESVARPAIRIVMAYAAITTPGPTSLVVTCDDKIVLEEKINLDSTAGQIVRVLDVPGAALWSPASPALHLLHIQLGEDDWRERIGIRQVQVKGQHICINDQPVRLLGFNRHESHPQFGHTQPDMLLVADIQQLRDMGCNFVRGSHYPQDPRFLDLCDETGVCVWSEAIGWQHTAEHLTDERFIRAQKRHIREMVAATFNHPAVILWGVLNEGRSQDARCRPAYQDLLACLRDLDPTRPVTYASMHPFDDACFDLADVISINAYPGWYIGSLAETPEMLDRLVAHLDAGAAASKPVIVSEIGAGAIPGWRDWNADRWTEQYQAQLLETVIRHLFIDRQRVCGLSIWLYNDFRTPASIGRPRGFNDKGVVDEYRRPKMAYEVVKQLYHALQRQ